MATHDPIADKQRLRRAESIGGMTGMRADKSTSRERIEAKSFSTDTAVGSTYQYRRQVTHYGHRIFERELMDAEQREQFRIMRGRARVFELTEDAYRIVFDRMVDLVGTYNEDDYEPLSELRFRHLGANFELHAFLRNHWEGYYVCLNPTDEPPHKRRWAMVHNFDVSMFPQVAEKIGGEERFHVFAALLPDAMCLILEDRPHWIVRDSKIHYASGKDRLAHKHGRSCTVLSLTKPVKDIRAEYISVPTGIKMCEHFCRSHERRLRGGKIVQVRAHWRGDPNVPRKSVTKVVK